jgi:LPS sulfotransferase NodH
VTSYLICGVQRCDSNLLCEALHRTGIAGKPTESFVRTFPGADELGHVYAGFEQSQWASAHGVSTFEAFLEAVRREGTTPNGVFGAKIHWNGFEPLLEKLRWLPGFERMKRPTRVAQALGAPRFIHLVRRDRVRQAVSWARAGQTGHYSSAESQARPALREPRFDLAFLDELFRLIGEGTAGWNQYFREGGAAPLVLTYEELTHDLSGVVRRVLDWLDVPPSRALDLSTLTMRKQADSLSNEWAERYRKLRPRISPDP